MIRTSSTISKSYTGIRKGWEKLENDFWLPMEKYGEFRKDENVCFLYRLQCA